MTEDPVLTAVTVSSLGAALAIFLLQTVGRRKHRQAGAIDFGTGFSAFVAGWLATELLESLAPAAWSGGVDVLHLAVMAAFAVWMNARWRWSLRHARGGA